MAISLSLFLRRLKLDVLLLGDIGMAPGLRSSIMLQDKHENGGLSHSYLWGDLASLPVGAYFHVLAWKSFYPDFLVSWYSAISDDTWKSLGGKRNIRMIS